jgi:hypothetical protein
VQLLSAHNYCQAETCSVLLASQGNPFTEALLWLYRSHNQHSRVLDALKEDKSVAVGGWNREQFYQWSADYLRWLWYHEADASLPKLALFSLKPLLQYDAEVGCLVGIISFFLLCEVTAVILNVSFFSLGSACCCASLRGEASRLLAWVAWPWEPYRAAPSPAPRQLSEAKA